MGMGNLGQLVDFILHIGIIAVLQLADVQHHVQLFAAFFQSQLALGYLDGRFMGTMGEADDCADLNRAALEHFGKDRYIAGTGANAGTIILQGNLTAVADVVLSEIRLEGRMIQHLGNIMGSNGHRKVLL